ncbi:MAG: hypothetical protein HY827_07060 [Actinobacteria bacterium]|nr:hypothetical protein [Actinomycetota bacterium]
MFVSSRSRRDRIEVSRIAAAACALAAVAVATILVGAICAIAPESALAIPKDMSYRIYGPGTSDPDREVKMTMSITNTENDPAITPMMINRLQFESRTLRFNGSAKGLDVCTVKVPNNGDPARCPRRSLVGRGTVSGVLGTPGKPRDGFGALSYAAGHFRLYNYRRRGGESARMVAVIDTSKPFAGYSINLSIPISRTGEIDVRVPELRELPAFISASYPLDTRLVITDLTVKLEPPRARGGKPFVWLRRPGSMAMNFRAICE